MKLPKMTAVRMKLHRPISEKWKLKSVTVSREPSGKYFASFAESFDAVCVEDLNLKGMAGGLHLGKGVHDNGYGPVSYTHLRKIINLEMKKRKKK